MTTSGAAWTSAYWESPEFQAELRAFVVDAVGEPTAFCSAGAIGPIGEATPAMPVTVCCG